MSRSSWVMIVGLLVLGIAAAVWADKGSWLNAVVTGACNACPAPPQGSGGHGRYSAGRGVRGSLPAIDGCGEAWWKRHS